MAIQQVAVDAFGNALGEALVAGSGQAAGSRSSAGEDRLGAFIEQNQGAWNQRQANYNQLVDAFGSPTAYGRADDALLAAGPGYSGGIGSGMRGAKSVGSQYGPGSRTSEDSQQTLENINEMMRETRGGVSRGALYADLASGSFRDFNTDGQRNILAAMDGYTNALQGGDVMFAIGRQAQLADAALRTAADLARQAGTIPQEARFQAEYRMGREATMGMMAGALARKVEQQQASMRLRSVENPLSSSQAEAIISVPKGSRPDPSQYLSSRYIDDHLAQFDAGASRFMSETNLTKYGPGQADGTSFVIPKMQADELLAASRGNPRALEHALGLPAGQLDHTTLMRVDFAKPRELGLRIPSGNEAGANPQWIPGGKLPDGLSEAVINVKGVPSTRYSSDVVVIKRGKP